MNLVFNDRKMEKFAKAIYEGRENPRTEFQGNPVVRGHRAIEESL